MTAPIAARLGALDWGAIERSLDEHGYARTPPVLTPDECAALIALFPDRRRFRSRVDMARFRFGEGEYQYFAAPLPRAVAALRSHAYPPLAAIANRWAATLGDRDRYPHDLEQFLKECAACGQTKPTPLLLRYTAGGFNCLHRDLYGPMAFPLQMTWALSRRGADFDGGESLLVEQRPRAQSRGESIPLEQGEALVFPTRFRPVRGSRGAYRAAVRHGVSRVHRGERYTLGIIFHDAA
jgi:hypothetical protein